MSLELGVIGNCEIAALVDESARIVWACLPRLDGDPFVDAQDWDIAKLAITVKAEGPKTVGLVSFENQGKPTEIKLDLVRTGMGWRIADIKSPSGTLSELYKK